MSIFTSHSTMPAMLNVSHILNMWQEAAKHLPNGHLRNCLYWDAVDAIRSTAKDTLEVMANARKGDWSVTGVARELVEKRAPW